MSHFSVPEWLFFDVGNVLMDETAWVVRYHDLVYEALREAVPGLTRERFDAEKWRGGVRADVTVVQHLLSAFLGDPAARAAARLRYWDEAVLAYYSLGTPVEGIFDALDILAPRYRLGVIANQHPSVREWMRRAGLDRYFTVCAFDCEVGYKKPDSRLFAWALEQAGCPPGCAVMIGDRLDNDIRPAKALGMGTIRLRAFGEHTRMEPSGPEDTPDVTVLTARGIPAAVEEIRERAGKKLL